MNVSTWRIGLIVTLLAILAGAGVTMLSSPAPSSRRRSNGSPGTVTRVVRPSSSPTRTLSRPTATRARPSPTRTPAPPSRTPTPSATLAPSSPTATTAYLTGVVNTRINLNVREVPGGKVIGVVAPGAQVRVLSQQTAFGNQWLEILADTGLRGWTRADFINITPP